MEDKTPSQCGENTDGDLFEDANRRADEANREIAGFAPTERELVQLAKFWVSKLLERNFFYFHTGETCRGSEAHRESDMMSRHNRIVGLLPEHIVESLYREAHTEFKTRLDAIWNLFMNRSLDEWNRYREELWSKSNGEERKEES